MRYLKSKISPKFHPLLFFLAFLTFFFSISPIQTCQKIWKFLYCFIGRIRDFTNEFWKFLEVLLKNIDIWNQFFCQNSMVDYLFFFILLLFLTFSFQFRLSVLVKKFWKFLCSFILWVRDFIKEFSKIMKHFLKKYRHLKSIIPHKFHSLLFILLYFF